MPVAPTEYLVANSLAAVSTSAAVRPLMTTLTPSLAKLSAHA